MPPVDASPLSRITAVLITYNSASVIGAALEGLKACERTIIIDNGPLDETAHIARTIIPDMQILRPDQNLGFGAGINLAATMAGTEFLLIVNPDTSATPEAIATLVSAADAYPQAAVIAPLHENPRGGTVLSFGPDPLRGNLPPAPDGFLPEGPLCAETLSGAFLLIRTAAFKAAGGFDDAIFLYYEDTDLCRRLRQAGYSLIVEPGSRVQHMGDASSPNSTAVSRIKELHMVWSRAYYLAKHQSPGAARAFARQIIRKRQLKAWVARLRGRTLRAEQLGHQIAGARAFLANPHRAPRP